MKKLFFLTILLFSGAQAKSQVLISLLFGDKLNSPNLEFGLNTGLSFSQISGLESTDRLGGFNLGLYFDIRAKNDLWIHTGILLISNQGLNGLKNEDLETIGASSTDLLEGDYNQRLSYWYVPILAHYRLKNRIFAELGPQVGLIREGAVRFEAEDGDFTTVVEEDNRDEMNRLDIGVTVGAGYKLTEGVGMSLGVRYYQGFIDVYENVSGTGLNNLYVYATIPIGAKKSAAKE